MLNKKKAFTSMALIFIYLILTSQLHYIQISNPEVSHARHLLRGFLDMLPLIAWFWFVKTRVIQPSVRKYLIIESLAMQFSMFVIYLQTIIITENVNLMALSVIGIFVPYFIFPVYSLLATLCLGMPEQFRLPKRYLILPAISFLLGALAFTNYIHEGFFHFEICLDDINRSSVEPRWLCYFTIIFCCIIIVWRLIATLKFTNKSGNRKTFIIILLLFSSILIYHIPYIMIGFEAKWELVGSTQYTFFIEILSWIICMSTGLVPINTSYDKVFRFSNMNFEIYDKNGTLIYPIDNQPLSMELFTDLVSNGRLQLNQDTILHISKLKKKGYIVWKEDISYINELLEQQEQIKKQLIDQEILLQNELSITNAKHKIEQRNAIYNHIDQILQANIELLDRQLEEVNKSKDFDYSLYLKIIQNGIYIKRKSNLLIISENNKSVPLTELKLTIDEMLTGLTNITTSFDIQANLTETVLTDDIIKCLDALMDVILNQTPWHLHLCCLTENGIPTFKIIYKSNDLAEKIIKLVLHSSTTSGTESEVK